MPTYIDAAAVASVVYAVVAPLSCVTVRGLRSAEQLCDSFSDCAMDDIETSKCETDSGEKEGIITERCRRHPPFRDYQLTLSDPAICNSDVV